MKQGFIKYAPFAEVAKFLRFPLAVMIVFIHSHMLISPPCEDCTTKWGGYFHVI